MNDVWFHSIFYYKFNGITFQKFPIDLWESMCDWMNGTGHSYVLDWSFGKILNYSNLNHSCPVNSIIIKVANTSMDTFTFEQSFLPSGDYRVDNYLSTTNGGGSFVKGSLYFSVSDHRLEIV